MGYRHSHELDIIYQATHLILILPHVFFFLHLANVLFVSVRIVFFPWSFPHIIKWLEHFTSIDCPWILVLFISDLCVSVPEYFFKRFGYCNKLIVSMTWNHVSRTSITSQLDPSEYYPEYYYPLNLYHFMFFFYVNNILYIYLALLHTAFSIYCVRILPQSIFEMFYSHIESICHACSRND